MNLALLAMLCLSLGITSGEILGQINDKGIVINKESSPERKLLYVVGIYPEWAPRIEKFKAKWGENGEKYLKQTGVYIHGDVTEPDENNTRRMNVARMEKPTLLVIPENRKDYVKLDDYNEDLTRKPSNNINIIKRKNPNIITSELPGFIEINATDTKSNYKRNNSDIIRRYQEYENFVENILQPLKKSNFKFNAIKKDNVEKNDEKNMLQNSSNPKEEDPAENEDGLVQRRYKNINRMYHYNWVTKPKNYASNRKFNNIDKIYGTAGKNENYDMDETIQNKPTIPNEMTTNYWMSNPKEENLESNESNRKYSNIDKMYDRMYPRNNANDDMDKILQKKPMKLNGITPIYTIRNPNKEDTIGKTYNNKNYRRPGPILKKARQKFRNKPELELKWIKQILLPRIINDRRNSRITSDEIMINFNVDDEINIENNKNEKKIVDNTDTEENIKYGKVNTPLLPLDSMEEMKKQRILNTKEQMDEGTVNLNLNVHDDDDDNDDENKL